MKQLKNQQGDVLFYKIDKLPNGVKEKGKDSRGAVFAEGEHTGHYHGTVDDVVLYEKDGVLFVDAKEDFSVTHQEHDTQRVPAGIYEIGIVQEYDYDEEAARNVID